MSEACKPCNTPPTPARNRVLDLLRLVFALMVLYTHAYLIPNNDPSEDFLNRWTRHGSFPGLPLGAFAVDGFFLISGFLIVQSWQLDPDFGRFLRKRLLRIVPGYAVAAILSTLAVGLLAPGIPHFFLHFDLHYPVSLLLLSAPITPPVLPGSIISQVDGSLWTVSYEFRFYLFVGLVGWCGLLRSRGIWVVATLILFAGRLVPGLAAAIPWPQTRLLFGEPFQILRLLPIFMAGGSLFLLKEHISFQSKYAFAALVGLGAVAFALPAAVETAAVVFGGYLTFYLAHLPLPSFAADLRFPDISYGTYLYGWPIQALCAWHWHTAPWITFLAAVPLSCAAGWLSWHFVERPALRFCRLQQFPPRDSVSLSAPSAPLSGVI